VVAAQDMTPETKLTEATGAFHFDSLAAGHYSLNIQKQGFQVDRSSPPEQIEVGPSRDGVVLQLSPFAKIRGRVTDVEGEPVAFAAIRAFRSQIVDGRKVMTQARSVTTDDIGRYRLWNLEPGSYYLLAAGRGGSTQLVVGHLGTAANAHENFAPVYYGGSSDRADANPIALSAGQEFDANVRVAMQPAVRVRGRLRNAAAYQQVQVQLLREGQDITATRTAVNAATGQFEIQDVVPGTYLLRASQGTGETTRRGQREVQVGAAGIDGLALDLAPGIEISGNVQGMVVTAGVRRLGCMVSLTAGDGDDIRGGASGRCDGDGKIKIENVLAGSYLVTVRPFAGYVASMTSGNVDLLHGGKLIVSAGAAPAPIEVVIRNDGGSVHATAPTSEGNRTVLLVPSDGGEPIPGLGGQANSRFRCWRPATIRLTC